MIKRYLESDIINHLKSHRQMIFLTGPRQVGKTTLAKAMIPKIIDGINYFNWDISDHRKILTTQIFPGKVLLSGKDREIIVFDEIHKYPRWKNTIKGLFDANEPDTHWIITGSAALDVYRRGQDSLVGRSFSYHLHPLSVAELTNTSATASRVLPDALINFEFTKPDDMAQKVLEALLNFSGFPEPYLKKNSSFLLKWRSSRLEKLINQDLAATESLKNLPLVENLMFLMPERVGSLLSINALREDLNVHFATVKHWIELLERVFYGFSVRPYSKKSSRMLKKETKWYLWDWTEINDPSIRFENLVAAHLAKYVNYINDLGLGNLSLHYVRDKEKREVDFLICSQRKPLMLIECKLTDKTPHAALEYFTEALGVKRAIQLTADSAAPTRHAVKKITIDVVSAASFLLQLV